MVKIKYVKTVKFSESCPNTRGLGKIFFSLRLEEWIAVTEGGWKNASWRYNS